MKKSYDYFKTLNLLSENVSVIYEKTLLKQIFSTERLRFFAEKSELINNLQNEFITPLERSDIFLLAENLSAELTAISTLQEYFNLINHKDFCDFNIIDKSLKTQNIVFSQLKNYKSNSKLFELCSDELKQLNSEKKNIEEHIIEALKCKSEQPLIKYSVYSVLLDLNRKIFNTILEIERILINNS